MQILMSKFWSRKIPSPFNSTESRYSVIGEGERVLMSLHSKNSLICWSVRDSRSVFLIFTMSNSSFHLLLVFIVGGYEGVGGRNQHKCDQEDSGHLECVFGSLFVHFEHTSQFTHQGFKDRDIFGNGFGWDITIGEIGVFAITFEVKAAFAGIHPMSVLYRAIEASTVENDMSVLSLDYDGIGLVDLIQFDAIDLYPSVVEDVHVIIQLFFDSPLMVDVFIFPYLGELFEDFGGETVVITDGLELNIVH